MKESTVEEYRIDLKLPLLIMKAPNGILACGYLNVDTFNTTEEVCAIVTGVSDFNDMRSALIEKVSVEASKLGIQIGESGESALEKMMSKV